MGWFIKDNNVFLSTLNRVICQCFLIFCWLQINAEDLRHGSLFKWTSNFELLSRSLRILMLLLHRACVEHSVYLKLGQGGVWYHGVLRAIFHNAIRVPTISEYRIAVLQHYIRIIIYQTLTSSDVLKELAVDALVNDLIALFLGIFSLLLRSLNLSRVDFFAVLFIHLSPVIACHSPIRSVLAFIDRGRISSNLLMIGPDGILALNLI